MNDKEKSMTVKIKHKLWPGVMTKDVLYNWVCPACKKMVRDDELADYCPKCGQKLDFED